MNTHLLYQKTTVTSFLLYLLICTLLFSVIFSPVFIAGKAIVDTSAINASYPWAAYRNDGKQTYFYETAYYYLPEKLNHLRTIAERQWPLWNPYVWSGKPNLLSVQSSIFYPLHVLYLLIPLPWAFHLVNFIEILIAAIFMYLFAREVGASWFGASLAGLSFTFSLRQTAYFGFPGDFGAFVYAPAFFFTVTKFVKTRRLLWIPVTALFMALAFSSALPDMAMWSFLALGAYAVYLLAGMWRKEGARQTIKTGALLLPAPVLMAGLCAIWLLPFVEASAYSQRSFSTVPHRYLPMALSLIFPELWGSRANGTWFYLGSLVGMDYDFATLYVGVIPLLFLVIGWRVLRLGKARFFALAAIATALLMLFINWIHPLIRWLPGIEMIRRFDRALVVYSLASSAWVALSATSVVDRVRLGDIHNLMRQRLRVLGFVFALLAAVGLIVFQLRMTLLPLARPLALWLYNVSGPHGRPFDWHWQNRVLAVLSEGWISDYLRGNWLPWLVVSVGSIWILWWYLGSKRPGQPGAFLVLMVVGLDLLWPTMRYLRYSAPEEILPATEGIRFLQSDPDVYRIATRNLDYGYGPRAVLPGMTAAAFGIQSIGGRGDFSRPYREYLERIESESGAARSFPHQDYLTVYDSKLLDMLNVKYIVTFPQDRGIIGDEFELVYSGDLDIYRNHDAMPRAWLVPEAKYLPKDQVLDYLVGSAYDPARVVVVEDPNIATSVANGVNEEVDIGQVAIECYTANQVALTVQANTDAFLVLADQFFPGWQAYVDGKQVEILRANYVMRAVRVPTGHHNVVFHYQPKALQLGARVSLASVSFLFLLALVSLTDKHSFSKARGWKECSAGKED